jgi:hypothetical protein
MRTVVSESKFKATPAAAPPALVGTAHDIRWIATKS